MILQAAGRAREMTQRLLAFGRKESLSISTVDLAAELRDQAPILRRLLRDDVDLAVVEATHPLHVRVDPVHFEQVLLNLAGNAQDAMPDGGALQIELTSLTVDTGGAAPWPDIAPGTYARLAVADTGAGMDPDTLDKVFDPFFTTKPRGRGTGLGLTTVYGIVEQHGGQIDVHSQPGRGTRIEIALPLAAPEEERDEAAAVEPRTADSRSGFRATSTTRAPAAAAWMASARPRPRLAPVMSTFRPFSDIGDLLWVHRSRPRASRSAPCSSVGISLI